MSSNEQHVFHHNIHEDAKPTLNVKIERNTKGYNFEVTVMGARTIEEATLLLHGMRREVLKLIEEETHD